MIFLASAPPDRDPGPEVGIPSTGLIRASKSRGARQLPTLFLLLPAIGLVLGLLIYPITDILIRSFDDGLSSYAWAIGTDANRQVFANTVRTAAVVTLISGLVAYPYAYALTVAGRLMKTILLIAVLVPICTSLMIRSFSWVIIFQQNGALNQILGVFGIKAPGLLGSTTAVLIGMSHVLLPFAVLPIYASMARIDRRLLDAARSLGANPVSAFVKVYLPLSLRGVANGALLVFVLGMGFFITPALLGSPSNTMASVLIRTQIGGLLDFAKGGALAAILLLITMAVLLLGALAIRLLAGRRPTNGGSRG